MRRLLVPILVLMLMVPFVPMALASTLLDSYGTANRDDSIIMTDIHPSAVQISAVGQSFTNTYTAKLYSVKFYMGTGGAGIPNGDLVAALYAHSGTYGSSSVPTGAALATSDPVAANGLTGPFVLYQFFFTGVNQYVLQPNIKYCIVVYRTGTVNQVEVGTDQTAPGHSGNAFRYNAGAWGAVSTEDTIFYIYAGAYGSGDGTYSFYFDNSVYENNTDAGSVDITAHTVNGTETFPVDAGTWYYSPSMSEAFSWSIGAATRWIYTPTIENFTVTLPYGTYAIYSVTVKDYTGKIGDSDTYLEAYRDIGGVETLIERQIIHSGNVVPLSLMFGSVYRLKILFSDGSRFNWGNFIAGSTTTLNLIVRAVEFSDQAQILYNDIHVEAARPSPYTTITIDYLDDMNHTVWANVTIRIRNGPIVITETRNNSSYTYNYASANASLSYVVTVHGRHTDYGVWGYSKIFDALPTFMAPPDLTGIFGGVNTDLIAFIISIVSLLTFSKVLQAKGLMATMFVASMLRYIGWFSISWNFIYFGWFIAIAAALTVGGAE